MYLSQHLDENAHKHTPSGHYDQKEYFRNYMRTMGLLKVLNSSTHCSICGKTIAAPKLLYTYYYIASYFVPQLIIIPIITLSFGPLKPFGGLLILSLPIWFLAIPELFFQILPVLICARCSWNPEELSHKSKKRYIHILRCTIPIIGTLVAMLWAYVIIRQ